MQGRQAIPANGRRSASATATAADLRSRWLRDDQRFASGNDGDHVSSWRILKIIGNYDSAATTGSRIRAMLSRSAGVTKTDCTRTRTAHLRRMRKLGRTCWLLRRQARTAILSIANDNGYGSGIWTTDLSGDQGFNAAPLPNGFDNDTDPLPDPNYTSRFNGTSAAAPEVSAVVALMLQANPNLTYRDVQEILVRSARQNAEFETPSSGCVTAHARPGK